MIHQQHSIQVIHFMLHSARRECVELALFGHTLLIEISDGDRRPPRDADHQARKTETSLFLRYGFVAPPDDLRIHEHCHLPFNECEAKLQRLTDLRGRQSRSVFGFHSRIHVLDELFKSLGHLRHLRGFPAEDRVVGAFFDGEEGHGRGVGLGLGG